MKQTYEYKIGKVVVKSKPSRSPEGDELKVSSEKSKWKSFKPKRYTVKKILTKTQGPELEANTNFKGRYSNLEGYAFDLGPRAL